ncbi:MAG: T9SS type A sorting domain-containing protein, partial [Chitinophagaceae bacterium]|nr:T9SS type A sorting domain-containing protein [Chitinophagaceae bacterium]
DGTIATYSWTKIAGPASFAIGNAAAASTGVTNFSQGTYQFRLVVTDNRGGVDSDTVSITVNGALPPPNQAPNANAGTDISITLPVNNTTLNGTASSDPDGTVSSYNWAKISGPAQFTIANTNSASTALSNLAQGTYSFRLVIADNSGATDSDTVTVTVNAAPPVPNVAPWANAGTDFSVNLPTATVYLNGAGSSDPDGSITNYDWVKISGPGAITIVNSTTALPSVVGLQAGTYIFELTVTDNRGATSKDRVQIVVNSVVNSKPLANAGNDTTIAVPSSSSLLNGTASKDNDGSISGYLWRQINGPSSALIQNNVVDLTIVNELVAGDYTFELTVTDNKGATAKDTVAITVVNIFRYEESLRVFPNPSIGAVTIRCVSDSLGQAKVSVYDMSGNIVRTILYNKLQSSVDVKTDFTGLKAGTYYIEVLIESRKKMITKFIKQ